MTWNLKATWLTVGFAAALSVLSACSSPQTSAPTAAEPASEAAPAEVEATDEVEAPDAANAETEARVVENIELQPGSDPMAMVFASRQAPETNEGAEQIKLNYPAADKAVVVVTKTGLADDSVKALRTRYEFAPVEGATPDSPQWQLVQVTEQNKCQDGRGSQSWTGALCK